MYFVAEAALLGLASGPACLVSCGPVLLPSLAAQRTGLSGTARVLSVFLSGRLAGYLCCSVLAWAAGAGLPAGAASRALLFGIIDLVLAALLVAYGVALRSASAQPLVTIGKSSRPWGPAALGLMTGLNICPPFLVAGARAAESRSLFVAVAFFLVFFLGTAVWSLPLAAVGWLRSSPSVASVARITLFVLAGWYAYVGFIAVAGRFLHGS